MVYEDERPFDYPGSSQGALYGDRDGDTYEAEVDLVRLNKQMLRVWYYMRGGAWWSLHEIAEVTGDPEASVSARIRDFRKPKFGRHKVHRRRYEGTFEYRLEWNDAVMPPTDEEALQAFGRVPVEEPVYRPNPGRFLAWVDYDSVYADYPEVPWVLVDGEAYPTQPCIHDRISRHYVTAMVKADEGWCPGAGIGDDDDAV